MRIRNLSRHTEYQYLLRVRQFAEHFRRSPEQLCPREIREFQVHLLGKVSADVLGQYTSALRFLYNAVLGRKWVIEKVACPKKPRRSSASSIARTTAVTEGAVRYHLRRQAVGAVDGSERLM